MFGGAGVYCDGLMFGLIARETLYFKADDSNRPAFEAEGMDAFTYEGRNKPIRMSYWRLPERLLDEPEEMVEWARAAMAGCRPGVRRPPGGQQSAAKGGSRHRPDAGRVDGSTRAEPDGSGPPGATVAAPHRLSRCLGSDFQRVRGRAGTLEPPAGGGKNRRARRGSRPGLDNRPAGLRLACAHDVQPSQAGRRPAVTPATPGRACRSGTGGRVRGGRTMPERRAACPTKASRPNGVSMASSKALISSPVGSGQSKPRCRRPSRLNWELASAGQHVRIIKRCCPYCGQLAFGTEIVTTNTAHWPPSSAHPPR